MAQAHDPYGALRFRDFRLLLVGNLFANLGGEMQAAVVRWEIYQRTGQAVDLGLVGLVQVVPVILLSLPAGQAADRRSRTGLFTAAQLLQALASLGLASLSFLQGPVALIYLCLFFVGVGRAFSSPARWALMPQIVPPHLISNAVTWTSTLWQIAAAAGPALGGLILEFIPPAQAYLVTASCALVCAGFIATIQSRPTPRSSDQRSLQSLLEGIRFVWSKKLILATLTLDLFAVLLGGATALLPIFADKILKVGPSEYGLLGAAQALGALVMSVVMSHRPPMRRAGRALLVGVVGFGAATIVFGFSENYYLSLAMLALAGAFDNISIVVRGTLVQVLTPDSMRGRVSAVNAIFIGSSNELGAFESGLTAAWFGPVFSVVGGGIGTLAVVGAVMLLWPEVLRLGPLHEAKKSNDPSTPD